jgi:hypothetical protein
MDKIIHDANSEIMSLRDKLSGQSLNVALISHKKLTGTSHAC